MFREVINITPFISQICDSYFRDMVADNLNDSFDYTFKSTLRALLGKRLADNEHVQVCYGNYGNNRATTTTLLNDMSRDSTALKRGDTGNIVEIRNFVLDDIDEAFITKLGEEFSKEYPEWIRVDKITEFFRKAFPIVCFINNDFKNSILITSGMDIRKIHYLQCAIPAFMPWYFEGDRRLTEDDLDLIRSLSEKTSSHYLEAINRYFEKYDFRSIAIKEYLAGFESMYMQNEVESLSGNIERNLREIREYNRVIASLCEQNARNNAKIMGLKLAIDEANENSELMDYFLCNKKLNIVGKNRGAIDFEVFDYLIYFDEDLAEQIINNDSSYVYSMQHGYITKRQMKKLMTEIFIEHTINIKTCAAYCISIRDGVSGIENYAYSKSGYLPNPHIHYYSCMGSYSSTIGQLLSEGNYIGAVEQCIASCKSLNFGDYSVMERFMSVLYQTENKFIELPDGSVVNPKEAIAWIESNEKKEVTNE